MSFVCAAVVRFVIWCPLFQKEHEQRRRRKSKAQFFEMIQEIRRYAWVLADLHLTFIYLKHQFIYCLSLICANYNIVKNVQSLRNKS